MFKKNELKAAGKNYRNLVSFCLGLSVIGVLFVYLNKNSSILSLLSNVSLVKVLVACLSGFLVSTFVTSITQQFMANSLRCRLGFRESFALTVLARSGNTLTPFRLGTIFRASYLKQNHNLSLIQFGSMFLSLQLILLLTGCLVTGITLSFLSFEYPGIKSSVIIGFFLLFFFCSLLLYRPIHKSVPGRWLGHKISLFILGWQALQQDRVSLAVAISGRVIVLITYTVVFHFVLSELGEEVEMMVCLFFSSVSSLTMFIQIIPGSLGITETIITFTAVLFLLPPASGFSAALVIRLCNIFFLLLLTLPCWLFLTPENRQKVSGK
ncbi:MAG: flippase-like domain-containing protein [Deltaproteobacteria bacterium]|nr:flippase-like domain-containing protein [Deltaproteobacteria bacterium]